MTATLELREDGETLRLGFDDLLRYHGRRAPGGVAHAFVVMRRAFALLDGPPERRAIHIRTAFPGPGARDAFEMATRAVTEGRYQVDEALAGPEVIPAARGGYLFEVADALRTVRLTLRPGFVEDAFIMLSRAAAERPLTKAEAAEVHRLKWAMTERLLSAAPEDAYDVRLVGPATSLAGSSS